MKTSHKVGAAVIGLVAISAGCAWTHYFPRFDATVVVDPAPFATATTFDFARWQSVLTAVVDAEGRVDYPALRADSHALEEVVATFAVVGPQSTPHLFPTSDDKLAYYLNAYNAFVLWNVVNRPDLKSVHDDKIVFFYGTSFAFDGGRTNLYDLENTTIRGGFEEPRVHFALNCASLGCPKLPQTVFTGDRLEDALERETVRFLAESRNVQVRPDGQAVDVSKIFEWYAEDFRPSPATWLAERRNDVSPQMTLVARDWDWALNAQPK